ncbi:GntR family transcriptional regulator [Anaerotignum sp. MB30-C6]|uniref:GntR family transcriptional regulator n=1 Tax=Anaerotignum sp. MB30-C6 TaxID=3070814 RepID=UPI0027DBEF40|nr:GntR family transcriptional regulator [Anaerotignum sp. MB30-C6]WMI81282.1 GntR family transcriptional regulator [Anaerotignum sp. MB30-C6]
MENKNVQPLEGKKLTLTNQIYQEIKDSITKKQFLPGEKLNIKELARQYNVSDTPVKQALQRLAEEKMVVNTPNKGMSVRTLTPHELNDIFDMRLMMDTFFIKDIISTLNYNSNLRQQLVENLEEQKKFIQTNESSCLPEKYFSLDMEFHTLYLTASGNKKAVEVLNDLQPFTYATGTYLNQPHYRDCECVAEHEDILKAAFNADLNALNHAIQTHIANSRRALQLIFKVNQMVLPNE